MQDIKKEKWVLTDEGKKYAAEGSPEVQLFLAVPEEGSISKDELQVITMDVYMYLKWDLLVIKFLLFQKKLAPSVFKIGCSQAGKNKWVEMGKQVSRKVILDCSESNAVFNVLLSLFLFFFFPVCYFPFWIFGAEPMLHSVYSIALYHFIVGSTCRRQSERAAFTNSRREGLCHVISVESLYDVFASMIHIDLSIAFSPSGN